MYLSTLIHTNVSLYFYQASAIKLHFTCPESRLDFQCCLCACTAQIWPEKRGKMDSASLLVNIIYSTHCSQNKIVFPAISESKKDTLKEARHSGRAKMAVQFDWHQKIWRIVHLLYFGAYIQPYIDTLPTLGSSFPPPHTLGRTVSVARQRRCVAPRRCASPPPPRTRRTIDCLSGWLCVCGNHSNQAQDQHKGRGDPRAKAFWQTLIPNSKIPSPEAKPCRLRHRGMSCHSAPLTFPNTPPRLMTRCVELSHSFLLFLTLLTLPYSLLLFLNLSYSYLLFLTLSYSFFLS